MSPDFTNAFDVPDHQKERHYDVFEEAARGGGLAPGPQAGAAVEEAGRSPNVGQTIPLRMGDIALGLREAEVVVEGCYHTHPVHQSYLEPQSVTVAPSPSGHHLVLWPSTQGLFAARSAVASALAMPERQIRVEPVPIGGGFGGKETLLEPLVAAMAKRLRKPVRLVFTRQEDLLAGNPAPQTVITVTLGAKRDGTLTAIQARVIVDSGAYLDPLVGMTGFHFFGAYHCPNIAVECDVVQTNKPGVGSYRAPSGPQAYFALESTVQELCQQLGMDPLQFRQLNALQAGDAHIMLGQWPRIGLLECLEQIQQHPLWAQREQARQHVPKDLKGWKIGTGLAIGGWPGEPSLRRPSADWNTMAPLP
jgi:CO/xanthine dehydrogenase Mo-binding subunit